MFIDIEYQGYSKVIVKASGKLDIYSADDYLEEVKKNIKFAKELILDFSKITYVASIGLRVILELHNIMKNNDANMVIKNPCNEVMNVFKMTGFDAFLNIENDINEN